MVMAMPQERPGCSPSVEPQDASRRLRRVAPYRKIAALFVETGGVYADIDGVELWDRERDARCYAGPYPVVAHPPCERWGRYWNGGPSARAPRKLGDDGGCFAAALAAVRKWGGVLEHPEGSHAWRRFDIIAPPREGGWVPAGLFHPAAFTCCVEQGYYGHRARKATWLYAANTELPALKWGSAPGDFVRLDEGFHSIEERRRAIKTGACQRLSKKQRSATPIPFRDLLLSIARSAQAGEARRAETPLGGSVHEHAVGEADAPSSSSSSPGDTQ